MNTEHTVRHTSRHPMNAEHTVDGGARRGRWRRGRAGGHRRRPAVEFVAAPLGLLIVMISGWYVLTYQVLEPHRRFLLPPLHEVWARAFADGDTRSGLVDGLWVTTKTSMTGLALAIALGILFAVLMSQARWIERSFYPWAVLIQTIPILAIVPLVALWFGVGFWSRVLVAVMISLFPIIANTLFGLQSASEEQVDLFEMHRAGRWKRLVKLDFPAAVPALFTGLRISAGLAVIGTIVGEFFFRSGERGLGQLIELHRATNDTPEMFGAVILSSLLSIAVFALVGQLGDRLTGKWHEAANDPMP